MTEEVDELVASLNINKILVAVLETLGSVSIPTLTFIDAANHDKELVIEYDEESLSFIFKLKENNEQPDNNTNTEQL